MHDMVISQAGGTTKRAINQHTERSTSQAHSITRLAARSQVLCVLGAGSYSYVAVGASGRTYEALARPVRRRLLFAGEHTSMEVAACCWAVCNAAGKPYSTILSAWVCDVRCTCGGCTVLCM